ncbi:MAG: hypothetical protein ACPHJ3_10490, partial [Rubripirellula sp.]
AAKFIGTRIAASAIVSNHRSVVRVMEMGHCGDTQNAFVPVGSTLSGTAYFPQWTCLRFNLASASRPTLLLLSSDEGRMIGKIGIFGTTLSA